MPGGTWRRRLKQSEGNPRFWKEVPPGADGMTHTHYECKRCGAIIMPTTPHQYQLGGLVHDPGCYDPPVSRLTQ